MNDPSRSSIVARRALLAVLTLATTLLGLWAFASSLYENGFSVLDVVLCVMFTALFVWVAMSFWMATAGFLSLLRRKPVAESPHVPSNAPPEGRTALLMPVYNEDPHRVLAGLRAIYESLQATGHGSSFDFFVLSDTTDPDMWLAEELAWAKLVQSVAGPSNVYYRHRPKNTSRKAGNIADFCERWGTGYDYMLVLDADSVMTGETIVEMVRRMDRDPKLGILQAPPMPVNRASFFARCQQFSARVYGPIFMEGFAWWTHTDGNYWGHNAIIRVEPFTQCCGLSKLPGVAPLGGEILSHDFVEAALMSRAGYKVCLAQDLEGSYEEPPPTLIDYAIRDNRWCQGNMQHIRLAFSDGMHPVSRLHLGMGAMSYLASPLWLMFLMLGFASVLIDHSHAVASGTNTSNISHVPWAGVVFGATMALLLLPKFWGYLVLLRQSKSRKACGGAFKAGMSVLIETIVSVLIAPVMMCFHTTFVVSTFLGRKVQWNAQQRDEGSQGFRAAWSTHWKQTAIGVVAGVATLYLAPAIFPWLVPVFVGLVLAIPLCMILSSISLGKAASRAGLLLTPEETAVPKVLQRHRFLIALPRPKELSDYRGMFRRLLADPAFVALHRSILSATNSAIPVEPRDIRMAEKQLLVGGPYRVSVESRKAILSDPEAVSSLHLFAWTSRRKGEQEAV
ncbi:MAG TPA: glucans biosynthesis glucosyltransferase MdoH [Pirellulales bacterium]|nr:glucans biosynthesis glucosyltransferase MdoH [Pirellulales bacterium]